LVIPVSIYSNLTRRRRPHQKDWFVTIEAGDIPEGVAWDLWIDGAYTKDKDNDPTGFMIAGFDLKNGRMIVRHFEEQWMTTPEVTKRIKEIHADYLDNASMIEIEPKASGYSFIQLIRDETLFNVTRITGRLVQDGKLARVNYAAPKIESGRVHLVRGNWNQEYITQMVAFPNYSHDEACDLTGYAVKKYFG
jgi:predicted phage terminase large subunit-like protein